ncbi:hypothetical protein PMKS-002229 [Pichia membranifaciens]|uniref:Uncharacterized protein n=1 Tax=Pichia membranifaciens TaxID=4926 RepID=A0A1Q2YGU1_9ASCO|nr:hypothetical protein PMKS-002229 [Pichia membranifaciens]
MRKVDEPIEGNELDQVFAGLQVVDQDVDDFRVVDDGILAGKVDSFIGVGVGAVGLIVRSLFPCESLDFMDLLNFLQEQLEEVFCDDSDILQGGLEVGDQRVEEGGQVGDQLEVWDGVKQDQPADDEQPRIGVGGIDALFQERDEFGEGEGLGGLDVVVLEVVAAFVLDGRILGLELAEVEDRNVVGRLVADDVLDQAVEDVCAVLDAVLHVGHQFAQDVKDLVEVDEDFTLSDLGNVVKRLAGVVADVWVVVTEAGDHRVDDAVEVLGELVRA